ncbi:MAG TPA: class I SAM-dependent methyltransferase [Bryobacteraceae bacterium]|nr:class I SAM-dependent methyltransferase [Bryobacteraceae bacterium]
MVRNFLRRLSRPIQTFRRQATISTQYVTSAPSAQNALDIFKGRWWSRLPEPFAPLQAGNIALFEDPRITWAISQLGGLRDQTVLELGPLEGAHSYMLEHAGAASIISIEANPEAYLKCLVIKEAVALERTHFLCGDFLEYLRNSPPHFEAALASGVLYHMVEPAELIALLSDITQNLYLWTHYYDAQLVAADRKLGSMFVGERQSEHAGFRHRLFRYEYWGSFGARQFCGGSRPHAHWMTREDILRCLQHFEFTEIRTNFEAPDHPDGPAFAIVARKKRGSSDDSME